MKTIVRLKPETMRKFSTIGTPCLPGSEYLGFLKGNNSFGFGFTKDGAHVFDTDKPGLTEEGALNQRNFKIQETKANNIEIHLDDVIVEQL